MVLLGIFGYWVLLGFLAGWQVLNVTHIKSTQKWKMITVCLFLIIFIAYAQEQY